MDGAGGGTSPAATGRTWRGALLGLGVVYALWSFLTTRTLGPGRDEVVYLSQVSPFGTPAYFSAPRARGITWLVWPVAQFTEDVVPIRLYLAGLAGVALVLAYWPWLRIRGLRHPAVAPLAAGLFVSLWLGRFYATQIMPNLWIAFGSVGAMGLVLRLAGPGAFRWWRLVLAGLCAAFVALLRPSDAAVVVTVLMLTAVATMRGARWRQGLGAAATVGLGALLGLVPWVVEAQQRFGGVRARLHESSATEGGMGLRFQLALNLKVMDGPILCRPTCRAADGPLPMDAIVLVTVCAALIVLAIVMAWRRRAVSAALAPTLGAIAVAAPYVVGINYAAPRFLLPTYALTSIPIALGMAGLVWLTPARWRTLTAGILLAAFALHLANQAAVFASVRQRQDAKRDRIELIADFLRSQGIKPGCIVSGTSAPQIARALGCRSAALSGHDANMTRDQLLELSRTTQVVLARGAPNLTTTPPSWAAGRWAGHRVPGLPKRWALTVFVPISDGASPDPSPAPTT